ncbi:hypothetical protein CspHIS471_0311720 [Cutaneotrichosporon sp. HIS471]|nr:hypothetical protein CspHIS471_0311720 [Cutaneotrichosporon sp. HIS471]
MLSFIPRAVSAPRAARAMSTIVRSELPPVLRRAMLCSSRTAQLTSVPGSNPRMIEKSLSSPADSVAYDLEDAVAPSAKPEARRLVAELLDSDRRPAGEVVARINAVGSGFEVDDLDTILRARHVQAIALPKTNDPEHLEWVVSRIQALCPPDKQAGRENAVRVIGMIESAEAMLRIHEIAAAARGHLDALLFAAEDYCADVGIVRTPGRSELLYPRAKLVTTARAFGLGSLDLVCVNFKDPEALRIESEEGMRLGFTGKQAIHPAQIDVIQAAYAPSEAAIRKAARVKFSFELHDSKGTGAYALDGVMIDAPVYKQAQNTLRLAQAAGLPIPNITEKDIS